MMAVTPIPVRKPIIRLLVSLPKMACRALPARRSSDCPITFIPNKKRARPPTSVRTSKISIPDIALSNSCVYGRIGDVVVMVKLNNYSDNTRENRIYIGGFPDVILTRDRWNEYLSQNGASVGLNLIRSALSANSIAGSIGSLSPLATMADIKRQPSSVLGSPGVSYPVASAELGWASYKLQVPAEEAQRIDEYFDIYGYSVNTVDIPSRKVRDRFTYVKTKELRVRGNNMPEDAITVISEAYNNGVTFWADNDNFMNYSIVIREANSLHNS